ncbi:NUDIX domain-containing protein [Actinomadura algeriensis]|uniref:ADP-ribose pyrophosphatase YjhB (NUDIX family) n=1 Tax=Actinomadura algeriensis TaxID=1679523 RepID=A0ABR9JLU0_9ACTN|nr:NUDIX domain-containing protein [Actinomadura algeriensis]MBE1531090.1 ADP-ribose pyrophosphatase YjhB (NUDIX family) [Actinomadura algeriensis]
MARAAEGIEVIARAVVRTSEGLLLARSRGTDWWFLPGGHVEPDESVGAALVRELGEELGLTVRAPTMIGTVENAYVQDGRRRHEINLVFAVDAPEGEFVSREAHLEFGVVPVDALGDVKIRPETLGRAVRSWLDEPRPFAVALPPTSA